MEISRRASDHPSALAHFLICFVEEQEASWPYLKRHGPWEHLGPWREHLPLNQTGGLKFHIHTSARTHISKFQGLHRKRKQLHGPVVFWTPASSKSEALCMKPPHPATNTPTPSGFAGTSRLRGAACSPSRHQGLEGQRAAPKPASQPSIWISGPRRKKTKIFSVVMNSFQEQQGTIIITILKQREAAESPKENHGKIE